MLSRSGCASGRPGHDLGPPCAFSSSFPQPHRLPALASSRDGFSVLCRDLARLIAMTGLNYLVDFSGGQVIRDFARLPRSPASDRGRRFRPRRPIIYILLAEACRDPLPRPPSARRAPTRGHESSRELTPALSGIRWTRWYVSGKVRTLVCDGAPCPLLS